MYMEIIRLPHKTVIMMTVMGTVLKFTKEGGGMLLVIIPISMDCTMRKALHPVALESLGLLGRGKNTP